MENQNKLFDMSSTLRSNEIKEKSLYIKQIEENTSKEDSLFIFITDKDILRGDEVIIEEENFEIDFNKIDFNKKEHKRFYINLLGNSFYEKIFEKILHLDNDNSRNIYFEMALENFVLINNADLILKSGKQKGFFVICSISSYGFQFGEFNWLKRIKRQDNKLGLIFKYFGEDLSDYKSRINKAKRKKTSSEELDKLFVKEVSRFGNKDLIRLIAKNENTSSKTLDKIAKETLGEQPSLFVAIHKNTSVETLDYLAHFCLFDFNEPYLIRLKECIKNNPNTSLKTRKRLNSLKNLDGLIFFLFEFLPKDFSYSKKKIN